MKPRLNHLFMALLLLLCGLSAFAQGKVYTRKARLEDFPTRTTKVVLSGDSFLVLTLHEEVATRWRISPYEFCTQAEYEQLRGSNSYYFLTLAQEEGIAYLVLSKGGREDEPESLRKPFEVVRVPIASIDSPSGRELLYMGAFLDIIQSFVEEAMVSDRTAYSGLSAANGSKFTGRRIYLDPDTADAVYPAAEPGALLALSIAPARITFRSVCYKMLISADTHELFHYEKSRYKGPNDARFSDAELRRFERRGGTVVR